MTVEIFSDGRIVVRTDAPCCAREMSVWLSDVDEGMEVVCGCGQEWTLHRSAWAHGLPSVAWIPLGARLRLVQPPTDPDQPAAVTKAQGSQPETGEDRAHLDETVWLYRPTAPPVGLA